MGSFAAFLLRMQIVYLSWACRWFFVAPPSLLGSPKRKIYSSLWQHQFKSLPTTVPRWISPCWTWPKLSFLNLWNNHVNLTHSTVIVFCRLLNWLCKFYTHLIIVKILITLKLLNYHLLWLDGSQILGGGWFEGRPFKDSTFFAMLQIEVLAVVFHA